ncbi:MAG TPA: RtcB family protein [Patescibacteria group bacterium]|nr:RtcB family protein [Patescibacteria group bacterium]
MQVIPVAGGVPIHSWAPEIERSALEQAVNLASLPFAIDHVALMPDAHTGYGMPIGGVLFADGAVVPYGIGVDIGCGVAFAETDLTVASLGSRGLHEVLDAIERAVPTGSKGQPRPVGRRRAEEEIGLERPASIEPAWWEHAVDQLGTMGSGNHFLEVQRDAQGQVCVMLHSGSRSLGKAICDAFQRRALAGNLARHDPLPHRELAYLREGNPAFDDYWAAMTFALRFAEVNRARMLDVVERAFEAHTRIRRFERLVDVQHNYAARETHLVDGRRREGLVHRKGAVRARAGETVLVPGSMETASYVGVGLGSSAAFETCQHGAGRAMSRTAARKARSSSAVYAAMEAEGVLLLAGDRGAVAEEAGFAYKDIEVVMAASADLVRPTRRLTPLGVVKG